VRLAGDDQEQQPWPTRAERADALNHVIPFEFIWEDDHCRRALRNAGARVEVASGVRADAETHEVGLKAIHRFGVLANDDDSRGGGGIGTHVLLGEAAQQGPFQPTAAQDGPRSRDCLA
jgi:hypothetical protein